MPNLPKARLAPVAYAEIARAYHIARALGGALLAAIGVVTTFTEVNVASSDLVLVGGIIAAHAVMRLRDPGDGAIDTILLDASLAGVAILFAGQPDITASTTLLYLLTATVLLLSPARAFLMTAYLVGWSILAVVFAPLTGDATGVGNSLSLNAASTVAVMVGVAGLLGAVAVTLITTRTRHESALETEREATRLKTEFVSMVSHELRTPLTSIAGFTETLQESWPELSSQERDDFLSIIGAETRVLSHLVEDILVIPRIEAGKLPLEMTTFELRPMCHAIVDVLKVDTDKDIEVSMPAGIFVEADFLRLQQVIRNLVVNAIKYGGEQILIQGLVEGDMLRAVVSDNGPGIDAVDRGRIFDRFVQGESGDDRTSSGVGLGLPIAHKLMRAMSGDLWFEPRFPTGANFFFSVKMATRSAASEASVLQKQ